MRSNRLVSTVASDEFRHVSTDALVKRMGSVFADVAWIDGVCHFIEFNRSFARLSFSTLPINRHTAGLQQRLLNRKVMCGIVFRRHMSLNDSCEVL